MTPLHGLKVLEFGQFIAGPYCGQLFADFGADVVKIEPPEGGDAMRQWGRTDGEGRTLWWPVIARGKRSLTLDLRKAEGQSLARELAREADIVVENFRVGRMEEWGLGYADLKAINPGIIMVRVTGYGQSGPYARRAGFASVCEAMGGMRYVAGHPDRPPVRAGISIGDTLAGQLGFQGALLALLNRGRTGEGQEVDAAIYEAVFGVMEALVTEYDKGGHIRERSGSILPGIAPSNVYPTADGVPVIIGANGDNLFRRLADLMGRPDLAADERFRDHRARGRHQQTLDDIIAEWTATKEAQWLVDELARVGVPAGLTYRAPEMLADPHYGAREAIVRVEDDVLGSLAMPNVFPKLSASPGEIRHTGPALGAHTEEILAQWLGWDGQRIAAVREKGVC